MIQPAHPIPGTKVPCYAFASNVDVSRHIAQMIAHIVRERNSVGQIAVLGLPTGTRS